MPLFLLPEALPGSDIDRRIHKIHIPAVEFLAKELDCFAKSLEVDNLTLPEESDHIVHIGIVREPEDVVIGRASLLLCCNGKSATFANKINPIGFIITFR